MSIPTRRNNNTNIPLLARSKSAFFHHNNVNIKKINKQQYGTPSSSASQVDRHYPPFPFHAPNTPDSPCPVPFSAGRDSPSRDHPELPYPFDYSSISATTTTTTSITAAAKHTRGGSGSNGNGTVRSVASTFFEKRIRKARPGLDDEGTYCVLSDAGVEVLAAQTHDGQAAHHQAQSFDADDSLIMIGGDPDETCHSSHNGEEGSKKKLKRTPSLGNLLKTPSRLNLRKIPSKLGLFADTPASSRSNNDTLVNNSNSILFSGIEDSCPRPAIPPVPHSSSVLPPCHPVSNTPTSNKSVRSTKSFLRRTVFRDRTSEKLARCNRSVTPFEDSVNQPLPPYVTVAARIEQMEERHRLSLKLEDEHGARPEQHDESFPVETTRAASVPLLDRPCEYMAISNTTGKTPRTNWLNKFSLRKNSVKKRTTRLEIPDFENSPTLTDKVENELKRRSREVLLTSEQLDEQQQQQRQRNYSTTQIEKLPSPSVSPIQNKPVLRIDIDAPPNNNNQVDPAQRLSFLFTSPLGTPSLELSPFHYDRLSLAVSPQFVNHTFTFGGRTSTRTSYFGGDVKHFSVPQQALVAYSPLSGDLHISNSPARNGSAIIERLDASFRQRESQHQQLNAYEEGDMTGHYSIFSLEEKEKIEKERPKSDPVPLKNLNKATNELKHLLDAFEDTFNYDVTSIRTSTAADTREFKHSYFASPLNPNKTLSPNRPGVDEIPDDLQDLIDGVAQLQEVLQTGNGENLTTALSDVSSFEGRVSTAQEALGLGKTMVDENPVNPDTWDGTPQVDDAIAPRHSIDSDRALSFASDSARSSMDGFDMPHAEDEANGLRPSFDSGRSSFNNPMEEMGAFDHPSDKRQKYLSSCSGLSARSSLRDYLAMDRPGLGDRMLQEVDEDVALDPIAEPDLRTSALRASYASSSTSSALHRHSYISTIGQYQTARTSQMMLRYGSTSESEEGTGSLVPSPTPANGLRRTISRHSIDCDVGDDTRRSLYSSSEGRPSIDSHRSFDGASDASPVSRLGQLANNAMLKLPSPSIRQKSAALLAATSQAIVKQSTASSMFSLSSVNSSPCPRPPRRKLLMLTGNRLPRPPLAAPTFQAVSALDTGGNQGPQAGPSKERPSMSPQQGRVQRLKDTWEAKLSPKQEASPLPSGSSPRYVRPLLSVVASVKKAEIPKPRPLSSLASGALVPPDTPPPSSPSASEMSFASSQRSSSDYVRGGSLQGRLANFGRRRSIRHRRQSSQLSRHSLLADPIPEETTAVLPNNAQLTDALISETEEEQSFGEYVDPEADSSSSLQACEILESYLADSPLKSPASGAVQKSVSPLVIRKTRSQSSLASAKSLRLGLDAFQPRPSHTGQARAKPPKSSVSCYDDLNCGPIMVMNPDSYIDWEDYAASCAFKWQRFCQEAVSELQKSRTMWPDTRLSLDILDSPTSTPSSHPSTLIRTLSTPGSGHSPDLTSPKHQSAIVDFIMDSQARYRSYLEYLDSDPPIPSTPDLSPDRSVCHSARHESSAVEAMSSWDATLSNTETTASDHHSEYVPQEQPKRISYQPKSLLLVEKHLSNNSPGLVNWKMAPVQSAPAAHEAPALIAQEKLVLAAPLRAPLQPAENKSVLPKSTKGYKPRQPAPASPNKLMSEAHPACKIKAEPIVRPLTPGRRIRAVASKRAVQVYADHMIGTLDPASTQAQPLRAGRPAINSFLAGKQLSQRRNDAFAAARRKLEGLGDLDDQTDINPGMSGNIENGHKRTMSSYKVGATTFEMVTAQSASTMKTTIIEEGKVLEAGGSADHRDSTTILSSRARPRPPNRRTTSGLVRNMR